MKVSVFIDEKLAATVGDDMKPKGDDVSEVLELIDSLGAKTPQDLLDRLHNAPYVWAQPA